MIKNERQYRITKAEVANFERALRKLQDEPDERRHPRLRQAEIDGVRSQVEEMREEITEYEALKSRPPRHIIFGNLGEMLRGLTRARIARGLSQKALGEKLHLKEQQIQRYEATDYEKCSTARVADVMQVLGVTVKGQSVLRNEGNQRKSSATHAGSTRAHAASAMAGRSGGSRSVKRRTQ